ncbi:hypothetical protein [Paraburkholderia youngii]|uniref:hypothetical protein n=1 Tax=Paraburkholderia youngii TaxID=2782701 RepID=UPI0015915D87|nr:hypothetical protein [Paraburkholderia youngii]NUX58642.1 hypothetical protein [Paraburkholderia youngii]
MGIGLILGAGLAGGAEGAGAAGRQALASQQEYQQKSDLVKMQVQLEQEKDMRIAALNHDYHTQDMAQENEYQVARDTAQRAFQTKENAADRASAEKRTGIEANATIQSAGIHASAERYAADKSAATAKYAADLTATAPTITSTADGHYVVSHRNLQTGQMDTSFLMADGKPVQGPKNIDAGRVAVVNAAMGAAGNFTRAGDFDTAKHMTDGALAVAAGGDPNTAFNNAMKVPITPEILGAFKVNPAGAAAHFDDNVGKPNGLPPGTGAILAQRQQASGNAPLTQNDVWLAAAQAGGYKPEAQPAQGQAPAPAAATPTATPPAQQVDPSQMWSGAAWTNAYNSGQLQPPQAPPKPGTNPEQFKPQGQGITAQPGNAFSVLNNRLTAGNGLIDKATGS